MAKFSPRLVRGQGSPLSAERQWRVLLYNNHYHRFADVVQWLGHHAGCSEAFASEICGVTQEDGRAVCFVGSREACHEVAAGLRLRGLQVEVDDF